MCILPSLTVRDQVATFLGPSMAEFLQEWMQAVMKDLDLKLAEENPERLFPDSNRGEVYERRMLVVQYLSTHFNEWAGWQDCNAIYRAIVVERLVKPTEMTRYHISGSTINWKFMKGAALLAESMCSQMESGYWQSTQDRWEKAEQGPERHRS